MAVDIPIRSAAIKLDSFLKWAGIAPTGGQAKLLIIHGEVRVNGVMDNSRSRQLREGDIVEVQGQAYRVTRAE
ncbi:MAG: RNA-binding S4 domain-containing protein [Bacillota bacterium]